VKNCMGMGVLVREKYGNECIMVWIMYDNMSGNLHRRWSIAIRIWDDLISWFVDGLFD
jgi:hypothetical protein